MRSDEMLSDLLGPDLRLVICGTAAGKRSANERAYYADPTNKFWPILAATGLTPRQFKPEEYRSLLDCGIGLTDLVKGEAGRDSGLPLHGWDVVDLKQKLSDFRPRVVCFNGKRAAKAFFGVREIVYGTGTQCPDLGDIRFFVAPSTSGRARRYWDERVWHDLAKLLQGGASHVGLRQPFWRQGVATKLDVIGTWDILETEAWEARALHVGGPAHLAFDADGMGGIAFVAVSGGIDYRVVTRDGKAAVEFCWQGSDEGDPVCGRGWAFIEGDTLRGRLFVYGGDDSMFVARRSPEA